MTGRFQKGDVIQYVGDKYRSLLTSGKLYVVEISNHGLVQIRDDRGLSTVFMDTSFRLFDGNWRRPNLVDAYEECMQAEEAYQKVLTREGMMTPVRMKGGPPSNGKRLAHGDQ
jgi:hypothetical protein